MFESLKAKVIDKVFRWALESKVSPLSWVNGHKTQIGAILDGLGGICAALSGILLAVDQLVCPGWQYCAQLSASILAVATVAGVITKVSGLMIKYVGEWHAADKASRATK